VIKSLRHVYGFRAERQCGGKLFAPLSVLCPLARITCRPDGRYFVEDLGSRNGTWLNGRKASRVEVKPGDELRLGGLVARLI